MNLVDEYERSVTNFKNGELKELNYIERVFKETGQDLIAIDVGAHKGIVSYFLQKYFRTVIGFEPNRRSFNLLVRLAKKLNKEEIKIRPYNCALGNREGKADLLIPFNMSTGKPQSAASTVSEKYLDVLDAKFPNTFRRTGKVPVKMQRMDKFSFGGKAVGLIKIDVEGTELEVLAGAKNTLQRHRPLLLIEIAWVENVLETVSKIESTYGYTAHVCKGSHIVNLCAAKKDPDFIIPYNFIFVPID